MKFLLFFLFLCTGSSVFAQNGVSFGLIDYRVRNVDAPSTDSLAYELTYRYETELEKVRAIYSWIAQHIAYNTGIFSTRSAAVKQVYDEDDTTAVWKSAVEMTAERVLKRRKAVCDGYAKLFKTLCDYSGIQAEIILGYAVPYSGRKDRFRTNHTWNAVRIDSNWYLLDVTWGSGYIDNNNQFVYRMDESYFLASPKQFARDHYPENLNWFLLEELPVWREYRFGPFKYKSFVKYGLKPVSPADGILEGKEGDTLSVQLEDPDPEKSSKIGSDSFFDSSLLSQPGSVCLAPAISGKKILYRYVIGPDAVQWINLVYNDDLILRYRLEKKKGVGD